MSNPCQDLLCCFSSELVANLTQPTSTADRVHRNKPPDTPYIHASIGLLKSVIKLYYSPYFFFLTPLPFPSRKTKI